MSAEDTKAEEQRFVPGTMVVVTRGNPESRYDAYLGEVIATEDFHVGSPDNSGDPSRWQMIEFVQHLAPFTNGLTVYCECVDDLRELTQKEIALILAR